jgi:uncharacterized membrane protein
MKVFLPRWTLWVMLPVLAIVWGVVTYLAFLSSEGREELGVAGWLVMTLVLVLVGVMVWLMASGRLPAYLIEVEDTDDPVKR